MNRYILDCSVTMAWCFADEKSDFASAARDALSEWSAIVPNHWPLEVANVLAIAERRNRINESSILHFIDILDRLPIAIDPWTTDKALNDILSLVRRHQLSAYDAAYLELAMRQGAPLASLDERLNEVAVGLGVTLFNG